jgi:hypothetical protein
LQLSGVRVFHQHLRDVSSLDMPEVRQDGRVALASPLDQWGAKLLAAMPSPADYADIVFRDFMSRTSCSRFQPVATTAVEHLRMEDLLRVDERYPVLWAEHKGAVLVAANGHFIECLPEFLPLISRLNTGSPITVSTLAQEIREDDRPALLRFLERLVEIAAATTVSAS